LVFEENPYFCMQETSVMWLRVATVLYAFGLAHAMLSAFRKSRRLFPYALGAFAVGSILHLVSIVEEALQIGGFPAYNTYQSFSLFGFLIAVAFLFVYWKYRFEALSGFIFPLVFLTSLVASLSSPLASWSSAQVRDHWLLAHVVLVLLGYAALLVTGVASVIYLVQEWQLKAKKPRLFYDRLPPLLSLDDLISKAMTWGFIFVTAGVVAGITWASIESGTQWITEPRIALSLLTWVLYLVMVFLRVSIGWRGRKAAIMVISLLGFFAATWASHARIASLFPR
jgi:ABC-type uncharacterized transport system permease subunit